MTPTNTRKNNRPGASSRLRGAANVCSSCGSRPIPDPQRACVSITDDVLGRLRDDVIQRRIGRGLDWARTYHPLVAGIDPRHRHSAALIGYLSQWADMGYGDVSIVKELLSRFPKSRRTDLRLSDYIHLRLADGMIASLDGDSLAAIAHFDFVISLGEDVIGDGQLLSLAHFWKARTQSKQGEHELALVQAARAREIAVELGYAKMAAAIQVLEGWLCIHREKPQRALEVLRESEAVLGNTDDFLSLSSIHSALGSIAMHEGRYDLALSHFANSISLCAKCDPLHRNVGRSLTNIAHAQRSTAIRLTRKIDMGVEERRRAARCDLADTVAVDLSSRQRVEQLRAQAFANLAQAEEIHRGARNNRGLGAVRIERGFLLLDSGDLERAELEAHEAWQLGAPATDYTLMAGARILQSLIEGAKCDEEIDDDPNQHALRAHDYSKDALAFAGNTDNRRLLARAYICQGLTFCSPYFNDAEAAKDCCQRAGGLLPAGCRDRLWEEYQALAGKLLAAGSVDATLRKWTQGLVENKTFQEMTEEFADLVIPCVWAREGKNISRVVSKLSISPKKVRRILSRVGVKSPNS